MHIKLCKKKGIFITIIIEKHQLAFYHNEMRQKLVCRGLQVLWSFVDVFGEKLKGIIVERSRGLMSWIRFEGLSLCCLQERVETCYRGELAKRCVKSWEDGGRKFRLECHANETSRFIHALWFTQKKKYCLVFLEGKGFLGGWATLAEKLHSLGVMTREEPREFLIPLGQRAELGLLRERRESPLPKLWNREWDD